MPTYDGPGTATHTISNGVARVEIIARGAEGGNGDADSVNTDDGNWASRGGEEGAEITAVYPVNELGGTGATLNLTMGGEGATTAGGYNGGGDGGDGGGSSGDNARGGGGGGYTEVRQNGRVIIAGGGGGGSAARAEFDGENRNVVANSGGSAQDGGRATTPDGYGFSGGGKAGSNGSGGSGGDGAAGNSETDGNAGGSRNGGDGVAVNKWSATGGGGGGYGGGGSGASGTSFFNVQGISGGSGGGGSVVERNPNSSSIQNDSNSGDGQVVINEISIEAKNLQIPYTGANEVDLSWDTNVGDTFEIERDGSVIDTVSSTTYTDTGFSENASHTYQVFALSGGSRVDSTSQQTTTTGGPPGTVDAAWDGDGIDLSASTPNGDFDSVDAYRDASVESESLVVSETAPPLSYADGAVQQGIIYTYRFESVYPRGASTSVTAVETVPLPPPTNLTVDAENDDGADVSWVDNADDEEGYRIEVREDDSGTWTTAVDGLDPDTESETVTGLLNGQLYGVRVLAYTPDVEEVDQ